MIKDTNRKNRNAKNRLQSLESGGFIRLFLFIIVIVVVLIYLGLDPKGIWENIIKPLVEWGFTLIVKLIGFLFDIAVWLIDRIRSIINI